MRTLPVLIVASTLTAGCGGSPPSSTTFAAKTTATTPAAPHDAHAGPSGPPTSVAGWASGAMLFEGLGSFHRAVTTSSPEAQKYFDQGMRLLWAFNHDEATRSFAKAAEIDPACAMCFWGIALTVGPNYNVPVMAEPRAKVAWEALQQAQAKMPHATPVEQALITALGKRYAGPTPLDPSNSGPILAAHATAMRDVAAKFPTDLDVQVLYAEALMDTNAWKLWSNAGQPAFGTPEIEATLEKVLAKDPTHPGANHYYIHTVEASPHPERALASAGRLRGLVPAAGHLQHMPAHIFQRVGRYADAAQANREGLTADVAYMATTTPLDYYGMYVAHNYQFLGYSASMEGRKAESMDAARKMRDVIPVEMMLGMPGMDWSISQVYATMIRFGMWPELLAEPAPDVRLKALTGGYLYARTVALAATGRAADAKTTLAQLEKLASETPPDAGAGLNTAKDVLAVAILVARANIAVAEGKLDDGAALLRDAIAKEDQLAYDEPADWFVPVRHQLGAILLKMGTAALAEKVYRDDLVRHPANGWALFGLKQALAAQHKTAEAAAIERQFMDAWKRADVTLSASVF